MGSVDARSRVRRGARVAAFGALTSAMLGTFLSHQSMTPPPRRYALRERYIRRWSRLLLAMFGVEALVEGEAAATPRTDDKPRGRLIVSNHRSAIDIGLLLREFGGHLVSREDLSRWPLIGAAARSVETVFVDRESTTSGVHAIRAMARLLETGRTVSVFAEGTTFSDDEVRPFHKGAFVAAKMAGAEIVPVGLAYEGGAAFGDESFMRHMARIAATRTTRVAMVIGEPIPPEKNAERAMRRTHERVSELVRRARARLDGEGLRSEKRDQPPPTK